MRRIAEEHVVEALDMRFHFLHGDRVGLGDIDRAAPGEIGRRRFPAVPGRDIAIKLHVLLAGGGGA